MSNNIRIVSTFPPRKCGIGTFSRDLATALENFTGEVGSIRIAAIDNGSLPYRIPVDIVIDQYNQESWRDAGTSIIRRASEASNPTVAVLQHEYGLDGIDCSGNNYVTMAKTLSENKLTVLVYLHTVLDRPDEHQRRVIRELAEFSDGLIVTTESAVQILQSKTYGVSGSKLKHIDHGIRMQLRSHFDRLTIKKSMGLDGHFLVTTIGLLSPGKGIEYGIRGYGEFLRTCCTEQQRQKIVYIVAGRSHPEFIKAEGGLPYRQFKDSLESSLQSEGLKWCTVKDIKDADANENDVLFLDTFLEEDALMELYAATNTMLLPYLSKGQISSGILADTLGSGRVAVATKFKYALELLYSNEKCGDGMTIGRHGRGILIDSGPESAGQISQALDYLVFNEKERLKMEKQAHQRGYQMRWDNSAWALVQHIDFVCDEKDVVTGRGVKFEKQR